MSLSAMTEEGIEPAADLGYVDLTVEAQPDVVFVTFGSDLQQWDGAGFRSGLTELLRRLLSDTDALVVLVGPAVSEVEHLATGRRALAEMETLSGLLSLPLVRTEAALLREGVSAEEIADEDGSISEGARGVIADAVLELLLHSQI